MEYGLQLFGATKLFRADPQGFLSEMKQAGYGEIEPCLAFDRGDRPLPAWYPDEFGDLRKMAEDRGLAIRSCHVFGDPVARMDALLRIAEENRIRAFVRGVPRDMDDAAFEAFIEGCLRAREPLAKAGIEFWLHNNWQEIACDRGGVTLYEAALSACGGKLGAQIDVGWALYGGVDPAALMDRLGKTLRSVHYKDIKGDRGEIEPREHPIVLGKGILDLAAVKARADAADVTQLVDQDASPGSLLSDLKESVRVLRAAP